ncbi:MAG: hypothetical protein K0R34_4280 [Herbinix sp.]|jgi:uncharacterized beta-barrel protein YwiB (DUF1934 family)|nr:hypothetical protein [Herbinix sp.]
MTKEVSITMEGIQKGLEDSPVLTTASGSYHIRHDKQYIQFDEQAEEGQGSIKNMIKIACNQVEMTKKGAINSEMLFDLNRKTEIIYRTSYGTLFFEAQTSRITVSEEEDKIEVILEYCLFSNDELISENRTTIRILSSSSPGEEEAQED